MRIDILTYFLLLMVGTSSISWTKLDKALLIDTFAELAVEEMHLYGIPASIKIAQAIVETNWGRSPLVIHANNYFGIKCKENWQGPTYMYVDDDRDQMGKLIPSCFRQYEDIRSSFRDHSIFLTQRKYYSPLFHLDKNDYISWAKGLKQCGYATDPKYAQKLIHLIEQYDLSKYDRVTLKK